MRVALRIDDIGASSKQYEVYSNRWYGLGNFLFLKYIPPFRAWGPYREMTPAEWDLVFKILSKYGAKLTVAITACWVEANGDLTPFPQKFPDQAQMIKQGLEANLIEVANHGLTHCVVEGLRFKPRLFTSNRKYHREFWDWIPARQHHDHLRRSQMILQDFFGTEVITFIPPGNVYSEATVHASKENGIRIINCNTIDNNMRDLKIISDEHVAAFHDRELVLEGVDWLEKKLAGLPRDTEYVFVKDL